MAENTKIEWADHTFNPWMGCTKISPACDNCYAESWAKRSGIVQWGDAPRRRSTSANWAKPLKWNAEAAAKGIRYRVFCASLADVFDNQVPAEWRVDLFKLIRATPNLDWLLLTKRIGNAHDMMVDAIEFELDMGVNPAFDMVPWPNIWLGATIANQEEADRDIPKLLAVPAHTRFLSMEPLLGGTWISKWLKPSCTLHGVLAADGKCDVCHGRGVWSPLITGVELTTPAPTFPGIDWVIAGGESGPGARPSHPNWFLSLRDQCLTNKVPFLFKQWGDWWEVDHSGEHQTIDADEEFAQELYADGHSILVAPDGRNFTLEALPLDTPARLMTRVGKKAAGRILDGRTWDGYPGATA